MDILVFTLKSAAYALTEPYWAFQLAVMAYILYRKNQKTAAIQKMIMGRSMDRAFVLTISQVVIGIFAGTAASIIMSYLGVVFDERSVVDLIFLATILFLFYNPRFVSIAYAGPVMCVLSLLLGYAAYSTGNQAWDFLRLDVPAVMTMVSVMLLVEGVLIILDGKRGSVPVFANREGKVIGGFILQRYWIVPVSMFFMLHDTSLAASSATVPMPQWWPVIRSSIPADVLQNALVVLIPLYGLMGFNSITFTKDRQRKALETGAFKAAYGIALFALAQAAVASTAVKILLPALAVAAHEGWVFLDRRRELQGKPKYVSGGEGMMVLEVLPESAASEMGIRSGDTLLRINDSRIESEKMLNDALHQGPNFIWLSVKREDGRLEQLNYGKMFPEKQLGLLLVPQGVPENNMILNFDENMISRAIDKIKKKENDK